VVSLFLCELLAPTYFTRGPCPLKPLRRKAPGAIALSVCSLRESGDLYICPNPQPPSQEGGLRPLISCAHDVALGCILDGASVLMPPISALCAHDVPHSAFCGLSACACLTIASVREQTFQAEASAAAANWSSNQRNFAILSVGRGWYSFCPRE
jgi:hypothetical protein